MSTASWRKCDFQVHSPRDPGWKGSRPAGEDVVVDSTGKPTGRDQIDKERVAWAEEFIAACLEKKLGAVAITDHHDVVMIPYVRKVIKRRRGEDSSFDLWFFPGMELTANHGKQCIVLFDEDLELEWLKEAQASLGIAAPRTEPHKSQAPNPTPLPHDFPDLMERLNDHEELKGRFIILPNMSERSKHTVLRDGEHQDFRRMQYVGGYLDNCESVDNYRPRNRRRVSGADPHWSEREIYAIPTSDSRSETFDQLGKNDCWMKMATPKAEAIRQAFLAPDSRIQVSTSPETPNMYISAVDIKGSSVLDDVLLNLSAEMNSVIGGRGTGKSTLLEYIAFAVGQSAYDLPSDVPSRDNRSRELIQKTLIEPEGTITVTVNQDEAEFDIVRSKATNYEAEIIVKKGEQEVATIRRLHQFIPTVIYRQGHLSDVGKEIHAGSELADLLPFVDAKYRVREHALIEQGAEAKREVHKCLIRLLDKWRDESSRDHVKVELDLVQARVSKLEAELHQLSDSEQKSLKEMECMDQAIVQVRSMVTEVEEISQQMKNAGKEDNLQLEPTGDVEVDQGLQEMHNDYNLLVSVVTKCEAKVKKTMAEVESRMSKSMKSWNSKYEDMQSKRNAILDRAGEQKSVRDRIRELHDRQLELRGELSVLEVKVGKVVNAENELDAAVSDLRRCRRQRTKHLRKWAREIEAQSGKKLRVLLKVDGDLSEIEESLGALVEGTDSHRKERQRELSRMVAKRGLPRVMNRLRAEVMSLLRWKRCSESQTEARPQIPTLEDILGGAPDVRSALFGDVTEEQVERVLVATGRSEVSLFFQDDERELEFGQASEGQRAAALLHMLLKQSGGPIIIDQPEDDLDNRVISELARELRTAKRRRQLVFASHNANIVVNGSSEAVVYMHTSDEGKRQVGDVGAIDVKSIRTTITSVMEGGEEAFKDRLRKYGY